MHSSENTLTVLNSAELSTDRAWSSSELGVGLHVRRHELVELERLLRASHTDENLMIEVEDLHPDTEVNRLDALSVHLTCQT